MRNRIIALIIAISLIVIGTVAIVADAAVLNNKVPTTNSSNQQIYIGEATIYGDGTEENSSAEVTARTDLVIKIDTNPSLIDLVINYTMDCTGQTDSGVVSVLVQINSQDRGHAEKATFTTESGKLVFENLEVNNGNILSFEIGAVYANVQPTFVIPAAAVGGGVIIKKSRVTPRILDNDFFQRFFILQQDLINFFFHFISN